jgi:putative ABC transport system permease protein
VRLGGEVHTVVGVMPEGFRFPISHRYWIPLRLNPSDYEVGSGPAIEIFGRLADGVTLRQANTELTTIGQRQAALRPETHAHLRPRILPYTHPMFDIDSPSTELALRGFQLAVGLLLIVVAVNVAILVYARTATRAGEIAVRNALGASRRRVVTQLFVEGLVLSSAAAILGLVTAAIALRQLEAYAVRTEDALPFWFDISLSSGSIVYAAVLAIAGGAIVGVIPALQATGRRVHAGLQQLATRGSRMKLGRVWTTLIVIQVAIAVTALPAAVYWPGAMIAFGTTDPGYAIDEFIIAWLSMERDEAAPSADAMRYESEFAARFGDRTAELVRRLDTEPGIDVTFASRFPGIGEEVARIELEPGAGQAGAESGVARGGSPTGVPAGSGAAPQDARSHGVLVNHIGTGLFDVFDVPVLSGRGFADADVLGGATAVIVDQTFVDRVAGGANVIGRRVRYAGRRGADGQAGEPGRWFEIVGVVRPVAAPMLPATINEPEPRLYHPVAAGQAESSISKVCCIHEAPGSDPRQSVPTMLIVRVRNGSAAGFTDDVRNITAAVDPALQLHEMMTVTEWRGREQQALRMIALGIVLVTVSVLLLSAAGIYAMMSFTVARQRREIGIRSALGAEPRRLLLGIFARAGVQLGAGVAVGLLLATVLELGSGGEVMGGKALYVLPVVSALILTIGLVAAFGPARRGLAVQPTEALRAE